ncbi:MAG: hypothetical protein Q8M40_11760 [Legionella sp.]|nr:hypothetical protein [Legionella sp.]
MEQKMEIEINNNWQILYHHEGYYPNWGGHPIIELFNPDVAQGTFYLTDHLGFCLFYQARNPQHEKNQQPWVECIHFLLTSEGVKVLKKEEYRLIVKGEHSFSWGTYQAQQSQFHLNITSQTDNRIFGSLIDFLASTPCKGAATPDMKYTRINKDYDTQVSYHYFDPKSITSSITNDNSLLDSATTERESNNRRLDWVSSAQGQSTTKHGVNFFHDKPFNAPGYYPHWGDRVLYELFNPKLKEGTFYFTRVDNEYRLYIQRKNDDFDFRTNIWVECQHFTLDKGSISITQIDELRLIEVYYDKGLPYLESFGYYKDYGCGDDLIGIASKCEKVDYNSLETYLQQFSSDNAAPQNLRLKRTANGYSLREPDYLKIDSICEEHTRTYMSHK